jgi:GTPase SAR1 family protein
METRKLKVVVVGDDSTGKSALVLAFAGLGVGKPWSDPTIPLPTRVTASVDSEPITGEIWYTRAQVTH